KIDRQQREDGTELNQHGEGLAEIVIVEAEKVLDQEEVPSRGHWQELGQALDDAEDEGLEKLKRHDGAPRAKRQIAPRSTARGRPGRRGFPASLPSEQGGRANIAQVARGRPYPEGPGHQNRPAPGGPARPPPNPAAPLKAAC